MSQPLARTLRLYGLFCTVAIGCLLPTAVAAPAANRLQSLVNDTAAQIQLAYRQHPDEAQRRQEQLAAVVVAWRAAARTEANNAQLMNWLHAAIVDSMPGSRDPLPPTPSFAAVAKVELRAANDVKVNQRSTAAGAKADADPFRDDPTSDRQ